MLSLGALTQRATADGVEVQTVERDYVLTHIMGALARHSRAEVFQFKGGTSLRLCHYPSYRYSADIDLNVLGEASIKIQREVLTETIDEAQRQLDLPAIELIYDNRPRIEFIGPTGTRHPRKIKLDIASDELIINTTSIGNLIHRYPDQIDSPPLLAYSIDETLTEKLRCVMQRLQCRDLYDIWRLTDGHASYSGVVDGFALKATHRDKNPEEFPEVFTRRLVQYRDRWTDELGSYMRDIPDFVRVEREVSRQLRQAYLL